MVKREYDLVIAGAGVIGLATAIAAKLTLGAQARILICDPGRSTQRQSIQAYAISSGPKILLQKIGVWGKIARVQPVRRMEITDSDLEDVVRQTYLNFDSSADPSRSLAEMVSHNDLIMSLEETAAVAGITIRDVTITGFDATPKSVSICLNGDEIITAGLLASCDGAESQIRALAKIPVVGWAYDRQAIVATVSAENDHGGIAVQHFLPAGTFALLPRAGNQFSVVWVEKPKSATALCRLPRAEFENELQIRAGNTFGKLELREGPATFPLRLQIARRFTGPRLVLMGDAAHTMHPLAGQGLNLGLRDIGFLMSHLEKQARLGLDLGQLESLKDYERSRRRDTVRMLALTDALFRIFTTGASPARTLRDFALGLVDQLPVLKSTLVEHAAGDRENSPRLLRVG